MTSLYDKYNGFDFFTNVVKSFYKKIMDREHLSGYFSQTNMAELIDHQSRFISELIGGPVSSHGKDLKKVHKRYQITSEHFSEVASILSETLLESGVEKDDVDAILKVIAVYKDEIVSSPD